MAWAVFSDAHLRAIGEMIQSGSERITAIVGAALLDDTLRGTLAERFRDDKDIAKKLLKVNGPFGNLGPKIDILYMLKAFEKPTWDTLNGIAEVRNFFAHNLDASFDSKHENMVNALKRLVLNENRTHYPHHLFRRDTKHPLEPIRSNRDRFIVNLQLCLIALMQDRVSHETHSFEPRTEEQIRETIRKQQEQEKKKGSSGP